MHQPSLPQFVRTGLSILTLLILAQPALPSETNQPPARKYSNIERLALPRLQAVHEDVMKLRAQRRALTPLPGRNDYRCILHAHAEDSDHTGGTLPEMLADAKKAGISAILLTDHFRPPRDFIDGAGADSKRACCLFLAPKSAAACCIRRRLSSTKWSSRSRNY